MKLLNVINARSVWLFEPREMNPRGKAYLSELISWLKDEYEFAKVPTNVYDLNPSGGLEFSMGSFQETGESDYLVVSDFALYNDGVVATTQSSTANTDAFVEQVLRRTAETFSLEYDSTMIRRRLYHSELNIQIEPSLGYFNRKLKQFSEKLNSVYSDRDGVRFEASTISFAPDPALQGMRPSPFVIERKVNTPFGDEKYYSQASLQTEKHISLLEELEALLAESA